MRRSSDTVVEILRARQTPAGWHHRVLAADEALLVRVRKLEVPWVTRLMRTFTRLGDASTWFSIGVGMAAMGGRAARPAALLGGAALAATAVSQVMKRTLVRSRPNPQVLGFSALTEHPDRFSFPSGHTAVACAVAAALAGEGAFLGPASLLLAAGIASSRVYLGSHYPLDVGAGALIGALTGMGVRAALLAPPSRPGAARASGRAPGYVVRSRSRAGAAG